MFNPKIIGGFGAAAFILSFIAGLLGDVSFGTVMLRAFLCGIGAAGIASGALVVLHKFLPELWDETSGDTEKGSSVPEVSGNVVDITVEDDALGPGTGGPSFYIHPEGRMASEAAMPTVTESDAGKSSSVPEPEFRAVPAASVAKASSVAETSPAAEINSGGLDELDSLPDMGDVFTSAKGKSSESAISADVFNTSDTSVVSGSDVKTMARAISSMLAKDS